MPGCTVLGHADTRTELELESMVLAKQKQALSIFLLIQLHFLSSNIISKEDVKSGGGGVQYYRRSADLVVYSTCRGPGVIYKIGVPEAEGVAYQIGNKELSPASVNG